MIIERLKQKEYKIPKNASKRAEYRHLEVIHMGYAKYLEAISLSGNFCMVGQFQELINSFNKEAEYSKTTLSVYASKIIKRLKKLGFIDTDYLNKYKYLYLKRQSFALVEGDTNTTRRLDKKNELKTDRFLNSLIKLQYLIDYNDSFNYSNMNNQLLHITKEMYKMIMESGNKYGYDLNMIKRIIELQTYEKIAPIISKTIEAKTRLGIIRTLWLELGKEYWKLGRQSQTIAEKPLYLKYFLQEDGSIVIHYIPQIVIFDTFKDLNYYRSQSNKFFYMFFDLSDNDTQNMQELLKKSSDKPYDHINKLGYSILLLGTSELQLNQKAELLNEHYYNNNKYSPLAFPCKTKLVDIDKYFTYSSSNKSINEEFVTVQNNIDYLLKEKMGC